MSKPLTPLNREDKGDADPGSQRFIARKLSADFPSYFTNFYVFSRFFIPPVNVARRKRVLYLKPAIALAAACMAIV